MPATSFQFVPKAAIPQSNSGFGLASLRDSVKKSLFCSSAQQDKVRKKTKSISDYQESHNPYWFLNDSRAKGESFDLRQTAMHSPFQDIVEKPYLRESFISVLEENYPGFTPPEDVLFKIQGNPNLDRDFLMNSTFREVYEELFGVDFEEIIQKLDTVHVGKKVSWIDKVLNDYISPGWYVMGYVMGAAVLTPVFQSIMGDVSSFMSGFYPDLFFKPESQSSVIDAYYLKNAGLGVVSGGIIAGLRHSFINERILAAGLLNAVQKLVLPSRLQKMMPLFLRKVGFGLTKTRTHSFKSKYLRPTGVAKKYLKNLYRYATIGVESELMKDFPKEIAVMKKFKQYLKEDHGLGKLDKLMSSLSETVPDTVGKAIVFGYENLLTMFFIMMFGYVFSNGTLETSDYISMFLGGSILTFASSIAMGHVTNMMADTPGRLTLVRQVIGIGVLVFATGLKNDAFMHDYVRYPLQGALAIILLITVGALFKENNKELSPANS